MSTTNRRCFNCNYDLADIPRGEKCPECGHAAFDESEVIDGLAAARYRRRWLRNAVLPLGVIVALVLIAWRTCVGVW